MFRFLICRSLFLRKLHFIHSILYKMTWTKIHKTLDKLYIEGYLFKIRHRLKLFEFWSNTSRLTFIKYQSSISRYLSFTLIKYENIYLNLLSFPWQNVIEWMQKYFSIVIKTANRVQWVSALVNLICLGTPMSWNKLFWRNVNFNLKYRL